ncbi:hypothetical protein PEPS_37330 (plasmid) [Persicobacter psychrovividus]|uniref:Uncharacterized protein n=1 Tax=Persicobacter psychrovividus TaxID=387638 RepID=A0ABM7VKE4_9BACT|nr:hypothetical protein PEPS_36860 [Persicobacter psychrovividus]BDD01453.1 hypothetical protein PEPS_37330 [Persicobacter psychrovividus]
MINSPSIFLTKIPVVVEAILVIDTSETFEFAPLLSIKFSITVSPKHSYRWIAI